VESLWVLEWKLASGHSWARTGLVPAGLDLPLAGTPICSWDRSETAVARKQEAGIRWRRTIAIVLIAVLSLWFNADVRLWAAGLDLAGQAQGAEAQPAAAHALYGHAAGHSLGHDHGAAPAGDTQDSATLDHSICSAHCVPAVIAIAVQSMPPQHFDRVAISRLPGPPGRRADPPLIPPEYRS
jgi:hypothetical protein